MIDYDSFSRCHLTEIFFAFHAGAKELSTLLADLPANSPQYQFCPKRQAGKL